SNEELKFFGLNLLESSERMRQLVERYILYTEIEAGDTYRLYSVTPIHAHHFILNAAGKVAQSKHRLTDLDLHLQPVMTLLSDEVVNVITFELVENAFKFSRPGQIIRVKSFAHEDVVFLEIDDSGSGLTQAELEQSGAFIQYNSKVQAQQGSGLGLIIVRRMLQLAGGTIEVMEKDMAGTTIRVTLPGIIQGRMERFNKERFQLKV
ncbi:MAG TPA: ATP-binding protein, partial [Bacteroidales bacterium]|nr:ATP-binding protein [Bacteroidales bacterium]